MSAEEEENVFERNLSYGLICQTLAEKKVWGGEGGSRM